MRGYFYTVKPGMGKLLLNINAATSAFYTPMTVAEFMKDDTFAPHEREGVLTNLRVHIEYDRKAPKNPKDRERIARLNKPQARIKTIKGFGKPIGHADIKFRKGFVNADGNYEQEQGYTRVIDHMKDIFGVTADPKLKAVNVGTDNDPCYYPQEFLRILPYQQFKKLVPEKLTDGMLRAACQGPQQNRALIEAEGLKKLGIVQKDDQQHFVS
jgi:eukaryotic translation initiation factor 2C